MLQDSLTGGWCTCTCDGVHYPHLMPALIVNLADKIGRLGNTSSSAHAAVATGSASRGARTKLTVPVSPYGFGAVADAEDHQELEARTLQWASYSRRAPVGQAVCVGSE